MHNMCDKEGESMADEQLRRVTINLPDDLYQRVLAKAKEQERTVSGYFRYLLRKDGADTETTD
jgi:hypothetical protein